MNLHHKNCGGELKEGKLREYNFGEGENYGWIPDVICAKCGSFIMGDAEIQESIDDIQFGKYAKGNNQ